MTGKSEQKMQYAAHIRRVKANVARAEGRSNFLVTQTVAFSFALVASLAGMLVSPPACGFLAVLMLALTIRSAMKAREYGSVLNAGMNATDSFVNGLVRDYERQFGEKPPE